MSSKAVVLYLSADSRVGSPRIAAPISSESVVKQADAKNDADVSALRSVCTPRM